MCMTNTNPLPANTADETFLLVSSGNQQFLHRTDETFRSLHKTVEEVVDSMHKHVKLIYELCDKMEHRLLTQRQFSAKETVADASNNCNLEKLQEQEAILLHKYRLSVIHSSFQQTKEIFVSLKKVQQQIRQIQINEGTLENNES